MLDLVGNPNCWFSHAQAHLQFKTPLELRTSSSSSSSNMDRNHLEPTWFGFFICVNSCIHDYI